MNLFVIRYHPFFVLLLSHISTVMMVFRNRKQRRRMKEMQRAQWTELANDIQMELSTILLCFPFFLLKVNKSSPLKYPSSL